jgi:hypothetical protein
LFGITQRTLKVGLALTLALGAPGIGAATTGAATGTGGAEAVQLDAALRPPRPDHSLAPGQCDWRWREGGGFGLWTEACTFNTGRWEVGWEDARGAFVILRDGVAGDVVLRPWPKAAGLDLAQVLPGLGLAGLGPTDPACVFVPMALSPAPRTRQSFVLQPASGWPPPPDPSPMAEVPDPPCGPLGVSTHAQRSFITDLRWPDAVIFVDQGQEGNLIEPRSLTAIPPDPGNPAPAAAAAVAAIVQGFAAECTALGGGRLQIGDGAVRRIDLGAVEGGVPSTDTTDWLIDGAGLTCPGMASLFCGGTGGCRMVLFSGHGAAREVLAKGWALTEAAGARLLILQVHGTECGGTNLRRCYRAVGISEEGYRSIGWD